MLWEGLTPMKMKFPCLHSLWFKMCFTAERASGRAQNVAFYGERASGRAQNVVLYGERVPGLARNVAFYNEPAPDQAQNVAFYNEPGPGGGCYLYGRWIACHPHLLELVQAHMSKRCDVNMQCSRHCTQDRVTDCRWSHRGHCMHAATN